MKAIKDIIKEAGFTLKIENRSASRLPEKAKYIAFLSNVVSHELNTIEGKGKTEDEAVDSLVEGLCKLPSFAYKTVPNSSSLVKVEVDFSKLFSK